MAIEIWDNYERSSVNIPLSSVVQQSADPNDVLVSIRPRMQKSEVVNDQFRWLEPSVKVTGVNNLRPTFRFTGYNNGAQNNSYHGDIWQATRRPMFSYNGVDWFYFSGLNSQTVNPTNITFRHEFAFTQDTVYISRFRQMSVHKCGEWIQSLANLYPGVVVPTISGNSFTPTSAMDSYDAKPFICSEFNTQIDDLGRIIPKTPLYGFLINDLSVMPASGTIAQSNLQVSPTTKGLIIFTGGTHAGEDHGNYILKAIVAKLMDNSADSVALRRFFKFLIYPMINAPGRAGGGWRGSYTKGNDIGTGYQADDANRNWYDNGTGGVACNLEIVYRNHNIITVDRAGVNPNVYIDYHNVFNEDWLMFVNPDAGSQNTFFTQVRNNFGRGMWYNSVYDPSVVPDYDSGFPYSNDTIAGYFGDPGKIGGAYGATPSVIIETGDPYPILDSEINDFAAAILKALKDMKTIGLVAGPDPVMKEFICNYNVEQAAVVTNVSKDLVVGYDIYNTSTTNVSKLLQCRYSILNTIHPPGEAPPLIRGLLVINNELSYIGDGMPDLMIE